MAKKKNDYFQMMEQQTAYCVKASNLLEEILCGYSRKIIPGKIDEIHQIEKDADHLQHEIINCLNTEFITPIDQEDIFGLVHLIDDITDALDDVVRQLYMYHIKALPEGAAAMAQVVNRCTKALYEAIKELRNFKKPAGLLKQIVRVNDIESEADNKHLEAMNALFSMDVDCKTLYGAIAIYNSLENCCDLCEHASEIINQIVIKNT